MGDKLFIEFINRVYPYYKHRIVHSHDPVPHIPLKAQGYEHSNTEIYYSTMYYFISDLEKNIKYVMMVIKKTINAQITISLILTCGII